MTRTRLLAILLVLLASTLCAATHRAVMPPNPADALGIGPMSGAAVSGSVASVSGTTITLNSGGAQTIRIDASAAKFQSEQGTASISDVKTGARISAFINTTITVAASAALPAQLIAIESSPDLAVNGAIQSIDPAHSTFSVLGINIAVDANTSYGTTFPTFAPIRGLQDLAVGQMVNVTAAFTNASILAKRVQITSFVIPTTTILHGTVKSISASAWVITTDGKDTTVTIDAQTKILGDAKVGDSVQVIANVDSAHNYLAIAIIKLIPAGPPDSATMKLSGWVKSIAPAQWTIGGPAGSLAPDFLVRITSTTKIYPNPAVGDHVVATGARDTTGTFVAVSIVRED